MNHALSASKKRQINELLYPINDETLYLASLFYCMIFIFFIGIVNNYEISEWEETYLRLWNKSPDHSYILASTFFRFLNVTPTDMLVQFFAYISIHIYIYILYYI